jgi:hypothetical protein
MSQWAMATLKSWRLLIELGCCPRRATALVPGTRQAEH